MSSSARIVVGVGALTAVLLGCTGSSPRGSAGAATSTPPPTGSARTAVLGEQDLFRAVIKRVLPSVVEIRTPTGLGSGVVLDRAGNIVTNYHVVAGASAFEVLPADSAAALPARLVGTYPPDDLAVIRITEGGPLTPATFADSTTVQVGDIVLAMGNPLGLSSSVTDGIVSAVGRPVTEPASADAPGATLPNTIQTSAAINPGNSGGALVNLDGQVIGIPTLAAVSGQGGGGPAPGIGFAIPSNTARDIAGQLARTGRVTNSHRAALGIQARTVVDPDGRPTGAGVVAVTSGGPAADAGLSAGDVIVSVNGTVTPDTDALATVLADLRPGQTVPVVVSNQDGGTERLPVTLGELP